MNGHGLKDSFWATSTASGRPRGNWGRPQSNFQRDGDWDCPSCRFSNFQFRIECLKCQTTRPEAGSVKLEDDGFKVHGAPQTPYNNGHGSNIPGEMHTDSDWAVGGVQDWSLDEQARVQAQNGLAMLRSNNVSTANSSTAKLGHYNNSGYSTPAANEDPWAMLSSKGGLSTSRWAPKNQHGRTPSGGEIWTRIAPAFNPTPQTTSRPPSPPDLGLPYEVQHYILSMMQRILEEACYDFASRWIPSMLQTRGWTCSEAVELSAWKKFLPDAIPNHALLHNRSTSYSLESALTDAVRIRNAAVHRHLCDNYEIGIMARKAQYLMEMFSDGSRRDKFWRLGTELKRWDEGSREDREAARRVLEEALKEIGERDMDDMDWSPNTVSLQEISVDVPTPEHHLYRGPVDEMELD